MLITAYQSQTPQSHNPSHFKFIKSLIAKGHEGTLLTEQTPVFAKKKKQI